jgi:Cu/Ag efflux protein CusF
MKTRSLLLATLIAVLPALAGAQDAPKAATIIEKEKGAVTFGETVELQGIITAIDKNTRAVTIKGGSGNELTIIAGPQVKNFKQIKVGDMVTLNYVAALGLELKKGGGRLRERIESEQTAAAKPGEKPSGGVLRTVKVVTDVMAVDAAAGSITLRGPQRSIDLIVKDKELLKDIRVGDQIAATYEEATVVAITPTPPPAPEAAPAPAQQ